ncbi:MAG TPA: DUF1841 family protein [Rhodocyclaceae bacterium]|nr:DUF1841 family protein [Rhodocyclaceae bacterium]
MFNPSRDQARQFIVAAWAKRRRNQPATPLEVIAADMIELHPEYHELLEADDAIGREWTPEQGQTNPFLHLSLHLAIEEQLSIDQPPGIRGIFERLQSKTADRHSALHIILECLGETIWHAQRSGQGLDGAAYLDCLNRAATRV